MTSSPNASPAGGLKEFLESATPQQWRPKGDRRSLRCPRTFPHSAHGPWFDGKLWRPGDGPGGFDCPGVELDAS